MKGPAKSPHARLPNFFIAGAPKAGTTSLHAYIGQHPQVFMTPIKEPGYFAAADLLAEPLRSDVVAALDRDRAALAEYLDGPHTPEHYRLVLHWDDYLRLFRDSRDEPVRGESSVTYFYLPSATRAIRAAVPHARIVFMLRDPAERLFSRYLGKLFLYPRLTFRAWFEAGLRTPRPWSKPFWIARDATHLRRYLGAFPREQIHVVLYRDFRADPGRVLRALLEFLGVDPGYRFDLSRRHNVTFIPRFPRLHAARRRVLGSTPLTGWLPAAARERVQRLYRRRAPRSAMHPADRQRVIEFFRDEITATAELIGRDLSAWLR